MWKNPLFLSLNELQKLNINNIHHLKTWIWESAWKSPRTDSQHCQSALQWVSAGCSALPSHLLHLWSAVIGFSLVVWAFPNSSRISGARRVFLELSSPKIAGCHWSRGRNTQKRPPKATVSKMGIDEEENTTTAASEMCCYLSISSIYRSSTVRTQFKFSREKAVFRISFTISPKYTFWQVYAWCCATGSVQWTIFLHTLSWHKRNLGICDSHGNLSLLQGENILNSLMLALPPPPPTPCVSLLHSCFIYVYLCLDLSLCLFLFILQVSN